MAHPPGPRDPDIQYIANLLAINDELLATLKELEERDSIVVPPLHTECIICNVRVDGGETLSHEESCPYAAIAKAKGETNDSHR